MSAHTRNVTKPKLVFVKSNFDKSCDSYEPGIGSKYAHSATIIVPSSAQEISLVTEISNVRDQQLTYLVKEAPIHMLLDKEFIEAFVKKGQICVLSHKRHLDRDCCCAILPTGHLILNITKDKYEQLGLDGKASLFSSKKPLRYVVDVDMNSESFAPGRKGYDRVMQCLRERFNETFDLLLSWRPPDEQICASSVSTFLKSKGLSVTLIPWSVETQLLNNILIPEVDSSILNGTEKACDKQEIWEWLGAMACGVDMSEATADSYISTLACPEPSKTMRRCCVVNLKGFLTPSTCKWLMERVRHECESIKTKNSVPWASITFHGFKDSPVSDGSREHGFFHEGDNLHSFLTFPNKDYWLYSLYGHSDLCQ